MASVESFYIPGSFGFSMHGFSVAFMCSHDCTWLLYLTSSNVTLSVTFLVCVCGDLESLGSHGQLIN